MANSKRSYNAWMRHPSPWAVIEAAPEDDQARDAALARIIDTCLEMQLVRRHESVGYQPFSVISACWPPSATIPTVSGTKPVHGCWVACLAVRPRQ